jgi:hypothetical protein
MGTTSRRSRDRRVVSERRRWRGGRWRVKESGVGEWSWRVELESELENGVELESRELGSGE